ncbi:sacsin N-terminal ATP-binding-like domain-containing protein [Evansella tamaricis]|uniref:DUF3883 domain-containing protein n=1 Tax=Evansella tamaricis TaxID=2069301 RepID=A0ABS6JFV7_9BACI|nr:DUF3883 domain-containing protein [Evansella tamaricis]MBU9711218.1 DUF3883 domain-containing protein [Evansella tamaricis]
MRVLQNANLEQLIEKRQKWIDANRMNGFNFDHILVGLYSDASHFIYEILQNAEDAGASTVSFELFHDRLEIIHNGVDFKHKDIDSITSIGNSTKKDDINKIGKFGVGFKSVYAVTKSPYIFSGDYHIKIEDFIFPRVCDGETAGEGTTKIVLPFNHEQRSEEECFTLVYHRLKNLGLRTLLFLKSLNEITWRCEEEEGRYSKSLLEEQREVHPCWRKVRLHSEDETFETYMVFEKDVQLTDKKLSVEVAYKYKLDQENQFHFIPEKDSKLVVFFPTEKDTYLHFVIQGPYKTTPARDNIPLEDEVNQELIYETGRLISESILKIKEMGFLDVEFLSVLPFDSERAEIDPLYQAIFTSVKQLFSSGAKLLPTKEKTFTSCQEALLAEVKSLTDLLAERDNDFLFDRMHWLSPSITENRTRDLWYYLRDDLNIETVDYISFARAISSEFLLRKNEEWLMEFYTKLIDQTNLWRDSEYRFRKKGVLRSKPFVKVADGRFVAPFDEDNNVQVYMPSSLYDSSHYQIVDPALLKDSNVKRFFSLLGLKEPDLLAEVKDLVLPKYQEGYLPDDYETDMKKIYKAYEKVPSDQKEGFLTRLRETPFILCNNKKGVSSYKFPSEVYFPTDSLRAYFADNQDVFFLDDILLDRKFQKTYITFLKDIGLHFNVRFIRLDNTLTDEEKKQLRLESEWKDAKISYRGNVVDFDLEGLKELFQEVTLEKSKALWSMLNLYIEEVGSQLFESKLTGKYTWYYRRERWAFFEVYFLKQLKSTPWLFDKKGNCKKASELFKNDLHDEYEITSETEVLINALMFKPDIEKVYMEQLSEDEQKNFKRFKELQENGMFEKLLAMVETVPAEEVSEDDSGIGIQGQEREESQDGKQGETVTDTDSGKTTLSDHIQQIEITEENSMGEDSEKIVLVEENEEDRESEIVVETPDHTEKINESEPFEMTKETSQDNGTVKEIATGSDTNLPGVNTSVVDGSGNSEGDFSNHLPAVSVSAEEEELVDDDDDFEDNDGYNAGLTKGNPSTETSSGVKNTGAAYSDWSPEIRAESVVSPIKKYTFESSTTIHMSKEEDMISSNDTAKHTSHLEEFPAVTVDAEDREYATTEFADQQFQFSPEKAKEIGDWGETVVFNSLLNSYREVGDVQRVEHGFLVKTSDGREIKVLWLNQDGNLGKGFDFQVSENGQIMKYIEVKSKVVNEPELIGISGNQWEVARALYKQGEGDKYCIFVVSNTGTEQAKIKELSNPFKLWLDGRIFAHPVNLKL